VAVDDRALAERQAREGLRKGKLSFTLMGQKLRGSWTLVRSHRAENEWLLIKHQDEFADADRDILADDSSIASGQTIADLKGQPSPPAGPSPPTTLDLSTVPGARP